MKVLLVKTSSLGDIVHTFPALTDAQQAIPGIRFDWIVEEAFAGLAAQHPAINEVIPCALRRWRKHPLRAWRSGEWARFKQRVRGEQYDLVIDAQGLVKSAWVTRLASAPKAGLDAQSARESLSAKVLDNPFAVAKGQHAVTRTRQLFARALGYTAPESVPDYGLRAETTNAAATRTLVFCHGTTWGNKHWPEAYWCDLAQRAAAAGYRVVLPWGNDEEQARAQRIAGAAHGVYVLNAMTLPDLLKAFRDMHGFVAVDTGLAHLAAAAGLPGIGLYGPTNAVLTGVTGKQIVNLSADFPCAPCLKRRCTYRGEQGADVDPPCFSTVSPQRVWQALSEVLSAGQPSRIPTSGTE